MIRETLNTTTNKTSSKLIFGGLGALALGAVLAGCGGNNATDTSPSTPPAMTTPPTTAPKMGTTTVAPANAAAFKDAAATWAKVTAANTALDNIIKANKLKEVHEAAFKVRDIVKTLPAKSGALSADKQKTLADQVKNVKQIAGKLDEAGDSNNMAGTKENQAAMNDALDIIKGLYPAGALG